MKKQMNRTLSSHACLLALLLLPLAPGVCAAGEARAAAPITGDAFYLLVASQDDELQRFLETVVSEDDGYMVTGPLDVLIDAPEDAVALLEMVRIICPDEAAYTLAIARLREQDEVKSVQRYDVPPPSAPVGFRGTIARVRIHGLERNCLVQTLAQARWLIWFRDALHMAPETARTPAFESYAESVAAYLANRETGEVPDDPPPFERFGTDAGISLFPPPPAYMIEGYDEFLAYLEAHREIRTSFVKRVVAFIPTDSLRQEWASSPPDIAWPSKAPEKLQQDYDEFLERGGDIGRIRTLTPAVLSQLGPGEYMFAVGLSGQIRFASRPRLMDVHGLEAQGEMIPRAVHGFLFPGEPLLSAGMFTVSGEERPVISAVNTRTGHFFYCNSVETIYDDVAIRSDGYLLTLGHFFRSLSRMGMTGEGIVVSKF